LDNLLRKKKYNKDIGKKKHTFTGGYPGQQKNI